MIRLVICCFCLFVLIPVPLWAAPAITCHCFTERVYDPARPASADPYFLATTQNSFFAALFQVDKKNVVMKKQAGHSADDLWIAYWVASRSGKSGEALLAARGNKRSWKEVVVPLKLPASSLGQRFSAQVAAEASASRLSQIIVDDVLVRRRLIGETELAQLRKESASNQEVIVTVLLVAKTRRSPFEIFREVRGGRRSWSALLSGANLTAGDIPGEFAVLLK